MNLGLTTTKKPLPAGLVRLLSIVGALAILAGVVWVGAQSFRALPNTQQFFANALVSVQSFFSPAERIVLTVIDSQIVVDEPFVLSWEHRGKDTDGSYTFFYECRDAVHLALAGDTVFCNTEIPLLAENTKLDIIARGEIASVAELPIEIRFRENNETSISERGEVTLLVQHERFDEATATSTDATATTGATSTPSTTGSTGSPTTGGTVPGQTTTQTFPVVTQPYSDPNGKADLRVRVLSYGLVHRTSGAFEAMDEIPRDLPSNKRGAIKFVVENVGTKISGEWEFEAELPTTPSYTFKSKDQQTLFPGDKIEFVIGFDRIRNADEDDYTIEVDPSDDIDELNESNNRVNGTIEIDR